MISFHVRKKLLGRKLRRNNVEIPHKKKSHQLFHYLSYFITYGRTFWLTWATTQKRFLDVTEVIDVTGTEEEKEIERL